MAARHLPRRHPDRPTRTAAIDDVWLRCFLRRRSGDGRIEPEIARPTTRTRSPSRCPSSASAGSSTTAADVGRDRGRPGRAVDARRRRGSTARPSPAAASRSGCGSGFRTVEIVGDVFTVNGRQVTFRGMNRHETHPVRGRVFDDEHARADLIEMKRHNVNAIRSSHYPPHPQVLDLADELGFWVIDECDLETHGFVFVGLAGQSERRPALAGRVPRPDRADGRAGQEPPVRGHLVARQRVRHRAQPGGDVALGPSTAIPSGRCTTRATTSAPTPTSTPGCTRT